MTTYQKLKKENMELRRELDMLANEPDCAASIIIKMKYRLSRRMKEALWFGNPSFHTKNSTLLTTK